MNRRQTLTAVKLRLLVGQLLVVTGIALLTLWAAYFGQLVRPIDIWDFCLLPAAFAATLIGARVAPRGRLIELVRTHVAVSGRRDLVLSLVIGTLAVLILWALFFFIDDGLAERYSKLARLQDPGVTVGLAVYRHTYFHLGRNASLYLAELCAFVVLIAMWSFGVFALLSIFRFLRSGLSK
jgi:hypothetical protein